MTHHADEEEKEVSPRAKMLSSKEELLELGKKMATRMADLIADLRASD